MDDIWHSLINQLASHYSPGTIALVTVQLLIIAYAIAWTWRRIRATQAERLVKGIMLLATFWIACHLMGLTIITAILKEIFPILMIGVVVVFQPELRRGLGYLGRTRFRVDFGLADTHVEKSREVIDQIIQAVRELSRSKIGALIVVEPPEGERDYISPGTTINAEVSAALLVSIFNPTSPLHDGAVVIRQSKIIAAGVILPMTDNTKISHAYGTRHRAALGLSERYDGLCIVASEETGAISAANRGMLVRYNSAEDLADALNYMYHTESPKIETHTPLQAFLQLFSRVRQNRNGDTVGGEHPRRRATDFPRVEALEQEGNSGSHNASHNANKPAAEIKPEGQIETA